MPTASPRALRQHGFTRVADDHVRDDEAELTERLGFHLRTHDVLILSGGVSMGKLDLVPKVLEKLGVQPGVPPHRAAARQADVVRRVAVRDLRCSRCPAIRCRRWCACRAT